MRNAVHFALGTFSDVRRWSRTLGSLEDKINGNARVRRV